ncbi:extensin-like [Penaeus monodon]|uniref:extensin-like n=1 Tax=Penaeus monodon TaxID=6687 RepID=UPI0018A783CA|nr:extensin-like [Penaeus monodon]
MARAGSVWPDSDPGPQPKRAETTKQPSKRPPAENTPNPVRQQMNPAPHTENTNTKQNGPKKHHNSPPPPARPAGRSTPSFPTNRTHPNLPKAHTERHLGTSKGTPQPTRQLPPPNLTPLIRLPIQHSYTSADPTRQEAKPITGPNATSAIGYTKQHRPTPTPNRKSPHPNKPRRPPQTQSPLAALNKPSNTSASKTPCDQPDPQQRSGSRNKL